MTTTTHHDLFCPHCGYNLRAIASTNCPECGAPFDPHALSVSKIPWVHRSKIGRLRAFLRTVLLATFRTKTLAAEAANPVSLPDALRFRNTLILLNLLPLLALALLAYILALVQHRGLHLLTQPYPLINYIPEPWSTLATLTGFTCLLFILTGLHTYLFHPRRLALPQQNRAVALAYYASAPLAFLPFFTLSLSAMLFLSDTPVPMPVTLNVFIDQNFMILMGLYTFAELIFLFFFWWTPLTLLHRLTHASLLRSTFHALLLPFLWLTLGTLALLAPPALLFYLFLMYFSFT